MQLTYRAHDNVGKVVVSVSGSRSAGDNADKYEMGDARCQLLVKNLPGLTVLDLRNLLHNLEGNRLTDFATRSVNQLHQLKELRIGTYSLI